MDSSERPWLKKGIVVKIVTKSLGEKYYKAKGHIKEVVGDDRMAAVVVLNNGGGKVKLDQARQTCNVCMSNWRKGTSDAHRYFHLFTSRKAGQHVLLVQGTGGTFSFLETSVHVKPLENL